MDRGMGLRTLGRWLYHAITSAQKRPYIKSSLEQLESLTAEAARNRDVLLLFDALNELRYRITSPNRRDVEIERIIALLGEFEGIHLAPDVSHQQIADARKKYEISFRQANQRADEETRRRENEDRSKLEAEERRQQEAEKKARQAASEKARLKAEAKANQKAEEKEKREVKELAQKEAAAEKALLEAEAKAKKEAEERKKREAKERAQQEIAAEKARLAAETKATKEAEKKAREEAAAEKARLAVEAKEKKEAEQKAREEAAAEQARLKAEAKTRKEAEEKAKQVAAAEKARLKAEAKAKQEAEERAQQVAAAENARLAAEEKAKKEAEKKAREEAAAEQARLKAEAKTRKEAEEKAKQVAAAEKARLEAEAKAKQEAEVRAQQVAAAENARLAAEEKAKKEAEEKALQVAAAETARLEAEAKAKQEAEVRAQQVAAAENARLAAEVKAREEEEALAKLNAEVQTPQEAKAEEARLLKESAAKREAEETALQEETAQQEPLEAEGQTINRFTNLQERDQEVRQAEVDTRKDASVEEIEQNLVDRGAARRRSHEEEKEERRELARLRRLEREGRMDDSPVEADGKEEETSKDEDFDAAEPFAPYLRAVPSDWRNWSEHDWNIKLLHYCFVQEANEGGSHGIPSTEEDLPFVTGEEDGPANEMAKLLVGRVRDYSVNQGLSPARLLRKRLETWNHRSDSHPRYFAFLWTTCLIAQGFPSPNEKGEFHKRYSREDIYETDETQYLRGNLPKAWQELAKWLNRRQDIFDEASHRSLILPEVDPSRTIISHSWKLSFPCRSDRRRLQEVLRRIDKNNLTLAKIDTGLIGSIHRQGGFTSEFSAALLQQIDGKRAGIEVEAWLRAIIQREIEALQTQEHNPRVSSKQGDLERRDLKLQLYLDDEDCRLELILPGHDIQVEQQRTQAAQTFCSITDESESGNEENIRELDLSHESTELDIKECKVTVRREKEEYIWRLRHKGLDNAVLSAWTCKGIDPQSPFILFEQERNERIQEAEIGKFKSLCLMYRKSYKVITTKGIEAEDEIRVSKLGDWRVVELSKLSAHDAIETITIKNDNGDICEISWSETQVASASQPLLRGLRVPRQSNTYIKAPTLWLPPREFDAAVEVFEIEREEAYNYIATINAASSDEWQAIDLCETIRNPGTYYLTLSIVSANGNQKRRWSKRLRLYDQPDARQLPPQMTYAEYRYQGRSVLMLMQDNPSPTICKTKADFWNAEWKIGGLWPHEQIGIRLQGENQSFCANLYATSEGNWDTFSASAWEIHLPESKGVTLDLLRQGFKELHHLAIYNATASESDRINEASQSASPEKSTTIQQPIKHKLSIVITGFRDPIAQLELVAELDNLFQAQLANQLCNEALYPLGERAKGNKLPIKVYGFSKLQLSELRDLREKVNNLIESANQRRRVNVGRMSANWERA
jgi:hypothetical protein